MNGSRNPNDGVPHLGFVGLGNMGMAMVRKLAAAGYVMSVFARRPEVAAEAEPLGAAVCGSVSEAASEADIMFVCVHSDEQVREVSLGAEGVIAAMKAGSTLVVHTTCSPTTAALLETAARQRNVSVVDAPVDGLPTDVTAGTLTVFMGADSRSKAAVTPVIQTYADPIIHAGPHGHGQRTKVLNILITAAHMQLVEDGAALAEQIGLDPKVALAAVAQTAATSAILEYSLAFGDHPRLFADAIRPFLSKDVLGYDDYFLQTGVHASSLGRLARTAALGDAGDGGNTDRLQQWTRPRG